MVIAEIVTLLLYAISIAFLPEYFGACLRFFHNLLASKHRTRFFSRPFVRHLCTLRLESCCHCSGQRFSIVRDQIHQKQNLPRCLEQTSVMCLVLMLEEHVSHTYILDLCRYIYITAESRGREGQHDTLLKTEGGIPVD